MEAIAKDIFERLSNGETVPQTTLKLLQVEFLLKF